MVVVLLTNCINLSTISIQLWHLHIKHLLKVIGFYCQKWFLILWLQQILNFGHNSVFFFVFGSFTWGFIIFSFSCSFTFLWINVVNVFFFRLRWFRFWFWLFWVFIFFGTFDFFTTFKFFLQFLSLLFLLLVRPEFNIWLSILLKDSWISV